MQVYLKKGKIVKKFRIALQFLTILPFRIKSEIKEENFGRSLLYFPIVGALIGILLALILFVFSFLPYPVLSILVLIILVIITGGIHLDGFADTCDGFYGSRPKKKILEIMRDSHTGVMGVIGIVCLLLLKFSIFISIPFEVLWRALILMSIFSRWAQVLTCFLSKYVRKEGKAKYFIEYAGKKEVFIGTIFTLVSFLLLMEINGLILFFISLLPVFLFLNYVKRKIGGMTGDTIGATSEIAEVSLLFFLVVCQKIRCFY